MIGFPTGIVDVVRSTDMNAIVDAIGGNGVHNGMAVTASGTGLTVNIAAGAYTANGTKCQYVGGSVTLAAADATNPRYDIITADSSGVMAKVDGTAATVPQYPATPAGKIRLAIIYVRPTLTIVNSFDIHDARFNLPVSVGSATITSSNAVTVSDRAVKTNSKILVSLRTDPAMTTAHAHTFNTLGASSVYRNISVSTTPALAVAGSPNTGISGISTASENLQYYWVDTIVDATSFKINLATSGTATFDYIILG